MIHQPKTTSFKSALFEFAIYPKYNDAIEYLAESLADKEDWDFSDSTVKKYSILKSYIEHTFKRLQIENKICYTLNNEYACFNTGLVTSNLEDIYAFYEKYKTPSIKNTAPYCFKAFLKKSDSKLLNHFSSSIPEPANYFEKPESLIFNPKCELIPDIDHIIKDNIDRFPPHLQNDNTGELNRHLFGGRLSL